MQIRLAFFSPAVFVFNTPFVNEYTYEKQDECDDKNAKEFKAEGEMNEIWMELWWGDYGRDKEKRK